MKTSRLIIISICFAWGGFVNGSGSYPQQKNCGTALDEDDYEDDIQVTSLQHPIQYVWASGYYGNMFEANLTYLANNKFSCKLQYSGRKKNFFFKTTCAGWIGFRVCKLKKDLQKSDRDENFSVSFKNNVATVEKKKSRSKEKINDLNLTFNADGVSCSIRRITFKECSVKPPLQVNSETSTYDSTGSITCEEGYELIPVNQHSPQSTSTRCMWNAEWSQVQNFRCYKAPTDTRVVGNLVVKENEVMRISCEFTQAEPPFYHNVVFTFDNGTAIESSVHESYMATVTMEDDGRDIRCHPIVEISQVFSNKGESPPRKLRVLFPPKKIDKDQNNWSDGSQNSWRFTFKSRPLADQLRLFAISNSSVSEVNFHYVNSSIGDLQSITITAIQLPNLRERNQQDNRLISQKLMLGVISSEFPRKSITFSFDLKFVKSEEAALDQRKLLLIYTGCAVFGLILVFAVIWKCIGYKSNKSTEEKDTEHKDETIYSTMDDEKDGSAVIYVNYNDQVEEQEPPNSVYNVIYNAADFGTDKINPIYEAD